MDTYPRYSTSCEVGPFYGRKGYPTQNVLAAIDFDLKFTYVLMGWERLAHDLIFLRDALERPHGLHVPKGISYLLRDSRTLRHVSFVF